MKLKEYAKHIAAVAAAHPDVDVVYCIDDEGNGFSAVHYEPSLGNYDAGEWLTLDDDNPELTVNAICIN